jgi:hypothetical protein
MRSFRASKTHVALVTSCTSHATVKYGRESRGTRCQLAKASSNLRETWSRPRTLYRTTQCYEHRTDRTYHQLPEAAVVLSTRASGSARSSSGAPRRQAIPALAHSPQDTPLLEYPDTLLSMTAATRLAVPTATSRHACFQRGGSALLGAERVLLTSDWLLLDQSPEPLPFSTCSEPHGHSISNLTGRQYSLIN